MNIIEALSDPDLFLGMFDAPSWSPWKVFLKALQALPMDEADLATYRHHTGRTSPPAKAARYAELVVGRRGGKSRILALIATYVGCALDHSRYIVPGETPVIAIIAKDRDQAKVIKNYIVGFMREIPAFADMIDDELAETVRLTNRVVVEVHTASIGAPRGRTFLAVLCDETAFWPAGDSANPDVEVINAVRPGLSTIPYSLLLIASSPYAKRGILYANYAKYFAKDNAPVLVWQGTTPEMNSTQIDDPVAADMYETDPERASAEYGAQFRSDIVAFITREAIENVVARGIREIPPGGGIVYVGFVDPSGGSADSFALAVAHMEADGTAVLDCIREVKPPFSPDDVVQEYAKLLKSYNISRVIGDAYAGEWPRERFSVHGISYEVSKKNKSAIYSEFLPALNGRRVRLLDVPRLTSQLVTLERRTSRGGQDAIVKEPGTHDDVANVACGVLVQVIEDRRPALIRQSDLLTNEMAAEHARPQTFFATMWVGVDGICAWAIFSHAERYAPKLVLIDFDTVPWSGAVLPGLAARLDDLSETAATRNPNTLRPHVFLHVPEQLVSAAAGALLGVFGPRADLLPAVVRANWNVDAAPIGAEFLADPVRLILNSSAHVTAGAVKLSALAVERAGGRPLLGSLAMRPGETITADPLRVAVLLGIVQLDHAWGKSASAAVRFR